MTVIKIQYSRIWLSKNTNKHWFVVMISEEATKRNNKENPVNLINIKKKDNKNIIRHNIKKKF